MSEETTPVVEAEIVTPVPQETETPAEQTEVKPEPVEKSFTQKELDEILEKRLSKERRKREDLQRRLAVTEELALKSRAPEPQKPADSGEPKRENFESYESYLEARADYRADRRIDERIAREREQASASNAEAEQRKVTESFQKRVQEVAKEIDDFEDVLAASDAPMTRAMSEAILHADEGPKLAYHLAKHPEEAERIAAMPAARQAIEIGKLEAKIAAAPKPEPKTPSKAPEPIKPLGGNTVATEAMPTDPDQYRLWRLRQRAASGRR